MAKQFRYCPRREDEIERGTLDHLNKNMFDKPKKKKTNHVLYTNTKEKKLVLYPDTYGLSAMQIKKYYRLCICTRLPIGTYIQWQEPQDIASPICT